MKGTIIAVGACAALAITSLADEETQRLPRQTIQDYLETWPDALGGNVTKKQPLTFVASNKPYANKAGFDAVNEINRWFQEGTAAGLTQDTFRSFDKNHSKVGNGYPQLTFAPPAPNYLPKEVAILPNRVTFGVQSFGFTQTPYGEKMAITEMASRSALVYHADPGYYKHLTKLEQPEFSQYDYQFFYQHNMVLVSPAVWTYEAVDGGFHDRFSTLSPHYLHSIGMSGSDAHLMKPILYAAASLPPALKTRALRSGVYAPLLIRLFKEAMGGGMLTVESAHRPAFTLPEESAAPLPGALSKSSPKAAIEAALTESAKASAPFLTGLLKSAHTLKHLPPVARLSVEGQARLSGGKLAYLENFDSLIAGALHEGQTLELSVDLKDTWVDQGQSLRSAKAILIREPNDRATREAQMASLLEKYTEAHPLVKQLRERMDTALKRVTRLEKLDTQGFRWKITIPWQGVDSKAVPPRTDMVFLVNDGDYDSAPAYLSIRHLQKEDFKWTPLP